MNGLSVKSALGYAREAIKETWRAVQWPMAVGEGMSGPTWRQLAASLSMKHLVTVNHELPLVNRAHD